MINGEENPAEKPTKGPNRFTRGRRRIGKGITDSIDGVKTVGKHWRYLAAGAVILWGFENRNTIVGAINEPTAKVAGELQGEPKPLEGYTQTSADGVEVEFPPAYEAIIRICTPIAGTRSENCNEATVYTTAEDTEKGRAKREGNKLTIDKSIVGEARPHFTISKER